MDKNEVITSCYVIYSEKEGKFVSGFNYANAKSYYGAPKYCKSIMFSIKFHRKRYAEIVIEEMTEHFGKEHGYEARELRLV